MASLAKRMRNIDEKIFAKIGEAILIGTDPVPGIFSSKYKEHEFADGLVVGLHISFATQYSPEIGNLTEGDEIEVVADGEPVGVYRFVRRIPMQGDESGKVVLELGSV